MEDKNHPEKEATMPLLEHLDELRRRIIRSMIAVLLLFSTSVFFASEILEFLKTPVMEFLPQGKDLGFKDIVEPFMVTIKVSLLVSIIAASPYWFYQFWKFVEPALYPSERKYILPFSVVSMFLFILGTAFCFWVIMPMALEFLISWGQQFAEPDITVQGYISFLTLLVIGFGLVFEAPLILVVLSLFGVINAKMLKSARRHVIVGCFVIAALITPPDWVSQIGMAVPLYFMFEIAILIILAMEKSRSKKENLSS